MPLAAGSGIVRGALAPRLRVCLVLSDGAAAVCPLRTPCDPATARDPGRRVPPRVAVSKLQGVAWTLMEAVRHFGHVPHLRDRKSCRIQNLSDQALGLAARWMTFFGPFGEGPAVDAAVAAATARADAVWLRLTHTEGDQEAQACIGCRACLLRLGVCRCMRTAAATAVACMWDAQYARAPDQPNANQA